MKATEERWILKVGDRFFEFTSVKGSVVNLTDKVDRAWHFRSREAAISKKQTLDDLGFESVSIKKIHGGIA